MSDDGFASLVAGFHGDTRSRMRVDRHGASGFTEKMPLDPQLVALRRLLPALSGPDDHHRRSLRARNASAP